MKKYLLILLMLNVSGFTQGQDIISTLAGNGYQGFSGDGGSAVAARLSNLRGVAVDAAGNVYINDVGNSRIRKVSTSGIISTVAGNGIAASNGDGGLAINASIIPLDIAIDGNNNLYLSEGFRIRKVNGTSGIISTIAGNGTPGHSGDGGLAINAQFDFAAGIGLDPSGNIYFTEYNYSALRRIDATTGIISTYAGFSGNTNFVYSGDGGLAINAGLGYLNDVAADASGNVFVSAQNNTVRKINSSGVISTFVTSANLGGDPRGITTDLAGNLYIADPNSNYIRKVTPAGVVSVLAGNGTAGFSGDGGNALNAQLNTPEEVAADGAGNVYFTDYNNFRVRKSGSVSAGSIVAMEYFIDTDPGVSNGNTISVTAGDTVNLINYLISVTGYAPGVHNLYVRAKNASGLWSVIDQRAFYILDVNNSYTNNTNLEYFIDTDPGVGNGTSISIAAADTISLANVSISLAGISNGVHNLYVRSKTSHGVWSVTDQRMFYVDGTTNGSSAVTEITKLEYFFDTDPGVGNATNWDISTFPPNDTISFISNVSRTVPCLSNGQHFLFIRAMDNLGVWSVVDYDTVNIGGAMATPLITATGPVTFCSIDNVTLALPASSGLTYQWFNGVDSIIGQTLPEITVSIAGNYKLRVKCNGSFEFSNSIAVNIVPTVRYYRDYDGDGYGNLNVFQDACSPPIGFILDNSDCKDSIAGINPGAIEICNGIDDNCNVTIDDIATPFTASIDATHNGAICPGGTVVLTATPNMSGYSYIWSNGATTASINVNSVGTYTVQIIDQATNCIEVAARLIIQGSLPVVSAASNTNGSYCTGNTIQLVANGQYINTYSWSGPNGFTSTLANPVINNATSAYTGTFQVAAADSNGCIAYANTGIVVHALPTSNIIHSGSSPFCIGTAVTLTAVSPTGASYLWSNGATLDNINVASAATYSVTVTDNHACTVITSYTVSYDAIIHITSSNGNILCSGNSVSLSFNTASKLWSTGATSTSITVNPTVNTTYFVQGTSAAGCIYYDTLEITVQPNSVQVVSNMIPSDNSFNLEPTTYFSWAPAVDASLYDLYVWKAINQRPLIPTVGNSPGIITQVVGLNYGTEYLWQVFSKNSCAIAMSDTQHFSTVPLPDLVVDSISGPSSAFSHSTISLTWRVNNSGLGQTGGNYWNDEIFISIDSVFNDASDPKIGGFSNLSFLNPGESYLRTESVFIPVNFVGSFYLFAVSDRQVLHSPYGYVSNVHELNEVNNYSAPLPIAISIPAAPDLIVTSVVAPTAAFGLDSIPVTYTIKNRYPTTANGNWLDAIYVSSDSVFDKNSATLLRVIPSPVTTLLLDSSYYKTVKVQLPDSVYGTRWMHVLADFSNVVFEATTENNNSGTAEFPLEVTLYPPTDLAVISVNTPPLISSGQQMSLSFTVQNQGAHHPIVNGWVDQIYFSTSPTWDPQSLLLSSSNYLNGISLNPGNSYTKQNVVTLPQGISGTYYIYVVTDANGNVFEYTYTANNILRSNAINVQLSPYPDLIVTNLNASLDTVLSGAVFNLSWTVANQGLAATGHSWRDDVSYYTSSNTVLGGTAFVSFGSTTSALSAGSSISRTANVVAPKFNVPTKIYFLMKTDANNDNYEYQFENNNYSTLDSVVVLPIPIPPCDLILDASIVPPNVNSGQPIALSWTAHNAGPDSTYVGAWSDIVYLSTDQVLDPFDVKLCDVRHSGNLQSGQNYTVSTVGTIPNGFSGAYYLLFKIDKYAEILNDINFSNSSSILPKYIQLTPWPDLTVTTLHVNTPLYAGQQVYLRYAVKNNGPALLNPVPVSDRVYISNSPTTNAVVATLQANYIVRALNVNQTYVDSVLITLPAYLTGNRYLVLKTDNRDSVFEYNYEGNNFNAIAVDILPAPIYDVQISQLTMPASMLLGQDVKIPYSLTNTGTIPISTTLKNAAYYSDDNQYQSAIDPVLSTRSALFSLAPGSSVADTFSTKVKDIDPGSYFGISRSNILNSIAETNYSNNVAVTSAMTAIDASNLPLNVMANSTLNLGDMIYFKITVGLDLDMIITLLSDNQASFNEIYVAYERTPTIADYDFRHQSQNKANQRVLVPATQAGNYYMMIKTSTPTQLAQNITVLATTLPFSILSIAPGHLGQGIVTTVIDGAGFRSGMNVYLKDGSNTIAQAAIIEFSSSMSVKVRWDLTNVSVGIYDLVLKNPDLSEVILSDGVYVEEASEYQLGTYSSIPPVLNSGRIALLTFVVENIGNIDIPIAKGEIDVFGFVNIRDVSRSGSGFLLSDFDTSFIKINYNGCCQSDEDIKSIPFMVRDMEPGQQIAIAVGLNNFPYTIMPLQLKATGVTVRDFILSEAKLIENLRQTIVKNEYAKYSSYPQVQNLMQDAVAFRDSMFSYMIKGGLLTASEVSNVVFPCPFCGSVTLSPGNGAGLASFNTFNIDTAGYLWEINDPYGTAGNDPGWDLLHVSNTINVNSTVAKPCPLVIASISSFNGLYDFLTTWEPGFNHRWPIAIAENGISGFTPNKFIIIDSVFAAYNDLHGGSFSLSLSTVNNDTLYLNFNARTPNAGENGFDGGPGQPGKNGGRGGKGGDGNCLVEGGKGGDGGRGGDGFTATNSSTKVEILPGNGGAAGQGGASACFGVKGGKGGNGGQGGDGDLNYEYVLVSVPAAQGGTGYSYYATVFTDGQNGGDGGAAGNAGANVSNSTVNNNGGDGGDGGGGWNGGNGGDGGDSDGGDAGDGGDGGDGAGTGGPGGNGGAPNGHGGGGGDGGSGGGSGGSGSGGNGSGGDGGVPYTPPNPPPPPSPSNSSKKFKPVDCTLQQREDAKLAKEICDEIFSFNCHAEGLKCAYDIGVGLGAGALGGPVGAAAGFVAGSASCLLGIYACNGGQNKNVLLAGNILGCTLGVLEGPLDAFKGCGGMFCDLIPVLLGCDPNEIIGPPGIDSARWISPYDNYQYTIDFENDSILASAPAQRVTIRQKLHANVNPFTVAIGDFGFANHVFSVPANSSSYSTRLALTDSLGVDVDVTAGVDVVSREVFWVLQSVDRNTGAAPYSPLLGLLPINNADGDGKGFVSYSIKANSPVNTGDSVTAKASIVFDINDAIETNTWINIIDAVAPTSNMDSLPSMILSDSIVISWSGQDDSGGSGVAFYDIYVSDNNGPFTLTYSDQPDTFIVFHGLIGHAYSFYSRATDKVGNREAAKSAGDVSIVFGNAATLNLKVFIEGYYEGGGIMKSVLNSAFPPNPPSAPLIYPADYCDTITVELHDQVTYNLIRSDQVILLVTGLATVVYVPTIVYPATILGGTYFIVVKARNAIETWSKVPVTFNAITNYDFTH